MAKNKENSDKHGGINPLAAGVAGAAVGLAVGVAAVELADKKNRQKVGKKLGELRDDGQRAYSKLKKEAPVVKANLEKFSSMAGAEIKKVRAGKKK